MKKSKPVHEREEPKPPWWQALATNHCADARRNRRPWSCTCGACQKARQEGFKPSVG